MTCCQWKYVETYAGEGTGECLFRLGAQTEWTGTTTSIFFPTGGKALLATDGTDFPLYNNKACTQNCVPVAEDSGNDAGN